MKGDKYFDHIAVEHKWQTRWLESGIYSSAVGSQTPEKFYNLWMFPYPSAEGLHAGHAFASTGSDIYGRFMRMNGKAVFQPIGYDSFGIHSENYAIKIGEVPQKMLERTTAHYEAQLKSLGHGYDWTRTVTTSDPDYYKYTQWLFVQLFKAGLAYRKKATVNWCPSCKTVLADEQVVTPSQAGKDPKNADGSPVVSPEDARVCERCATVVEKKDLAQWFFRITEYADNLLEGLAKIDWPERIKIAQREWIGRKSGITIKYQIDKSDEDTKDSPTEIECWTSRPDTNFGATFIVLAPEHPFASAITLSQYRDSVDAYVEAALAKSKVERESEKRVKTGVFTGRYAINSLNGEKLPVYVSDFVIGGVGTGAVIGVPGHDRRDYEFARAMKLPVKRVVVGEDGDKSEIMDISQVQEEEGVMINSEFLDGMKILDAKEKIMAYLEEKGWGEKTENYHLRDWLISRQRYWGAPIPMIHCDKCRENQTGWFETNPASIRDEQSDWDWYGWYPEEDLPVELPEMKDYQPEGNGRGPLANHPEFYQVKCPVCGSDARRETDVCDTFLDSSWYFLRYPSVGSDVGSSLGGGLPAGAAARSSSDTPRQPDPDLKISDLDIPWNTEVTRRWLPVDLYFGGAEHSVLHLMYARFVTMVLCDLGYLAFSEPFPHFYAHGLMIKDGAKMSKSRGNVVNPDEYVEKYGADALRLYLMFMGPMDGYPDFRDTGIEGMKRFVDRLWRILSSAPDTAKEVSSKVKTALARAIKKLTEDIKVFHYNTAIAAIMELTNALEDSNGGFGRKELETLTLLIAPFAPHLAEEVWCEVLGNSYSVHNQAWPVFDEQALVEDTATIVVQVNGKVRGQVEIAKDRVHEQDWVVTEARKNEMVNKWLATEPKKTIYVPGKIVNFVV